MLQYMPLCISMFASICKKLKLLYSLALIKNQRAPDICSIPLMITVTISPLSV